MALTIDFLNDYIRSWGAHPKNHEQKPFFDSLFIFSRRNFPDLGTVKLYRLGNESRKFWVSVMSNEGNLHATLTKSGAEIVEHSVKFFVNTELKFEHYFPGYKEEKLFANYLRLYQKAYNISFWETVFNERAVNIPNHGFARLVSLAPSSHEGGSYSMTVSVENSERMTMFYTVNYVESGEWRYWQSCQFSRPVIQTSIEVKEC